MSMIVADSSNCKIELEVWGDICSKYNFEKDDVLQIINASVYEFQN